jgi:hypothetical protein
MIYVVFALIVAAAVIYLTFSDSRHVRAQQGTESTERSQLRERLQSLKLSLRDIEYERTIGKTDATNHDRLQNEYLSEYDSIEKKLAALDAASPAGAVPKVENCPSCGADILSVAAKFCHSCGAKLMMALCILGFALMPGNLLAYDIHVTVTQGATKTVAAEPHTVQLLKLEKGMQPVTSKVTQNGKVDFSNLPEMTAGPYMVQVQYKGVAYSRVIPPNVPSPAEISLEIFESTTSTAKLRVRTLIELRRVSKDTLAGLMILFFLNSDSKTFVGGARGLEFLLPGEAKIDSASISVGTGASNIQWLKLAPEQAPEGKYSVGQNVKPGERVLQVFFHLPYKDSGTNLEFNSLYPQDAGMQFIVEPDDVTVKSGATLLKRIRDPNLGRGLIPFSVGDRTVVLALSGGSIAEVRKEEDAELVIKSPLELWQKLVFPIIALLVFISAAAMRHRWKST